MCIRWTDDINIFVTIVNGKNTEEVKKRGWEGGEIERMTNRYGRSR